MFGGLFADLKGSIPDVMWGTVGFAGESYLPLWLGGYVSLPLDKAGNPLAYYGVKAGSGVATAWIVSKFAGRTAGRAALVGALLGLVSEPINEFLMPILIGGVMPKVGPGTSSYLRSYLQDSGAGYLSPGPTVGDSDDDDDDSGAAGFGSFGGVERLNPGQRLA